MVNKTKNKTDNKDQVVLVDEADQELGSTNLLAAHQKPGQLHRAISVFVFRKRESQGNQAGEVELLLQQRSAAKPAAAGAWANTVCGHVKVGESYQQAAERRLKKELGLDSSNLSQLQPLIKFSYQVAVDDELAEHELDQLYLAWWPQQQAEQKVGQEVKQKTKQKIELELNPQEVQATQWVNWSELLLVSKTNSRLKQFKNLKLAPWFVLFLQRPEIIEGIKDFLEN